MHPGLSNLEISIVWGFFSPFKKYIFIDLLKTEEGRERGRERNIIQSAAIHMHSERRMNLQPDHVPRPGIEPVTFQ